MLCCVTWIFCMFGVWGRTDVKCYNERILTCQNAVWVSSVLLSMSKINVKKGVGI